MAREHHQKPALTNRHQTSSLHGADNTTRPLQEVVHGLEACMTDGIRVTYTGEITK